jgi:chromosome segregation ATPase
MKAFLQNLLIFFALALCALVSFQWVRETDLRRDVQGLTDNVQTEKQKVIDLQGVVRSNEREIQRLDGLRLQMTQTIKTNEAQITTLIKDLDKNTIELERARNQIDLYKDAIEKANENIKRQNDDIRRQNEEMVKMAEERNDIVQKYNKMAADFNDLAARWNKQQEDLARAATNNPAQQPPPKK